MTINVTTFDEIELAEDDLSFEQSSISKLENLSCRIFGKMPVYAGHFLILTKKQYDKYFDLTGMDHYSYEDYLERLCILYPLELLQTRGIVSLTKPSSSKSMKNKLVFFASMNSSTLSALSLKPV